ncbi:MAG TPA: metallophosphoesterase, partial [Bacteroidales bacterium]|nr:metallophosphoesterase [Bacteroidales bacterium]
AFWFTVSTFIVARILERAHPGLISYIFTWMGSFWLAFMLFFFVFILFIDITRVFNSFLHFYPRWLIADPAKTKLILFYAILGIVTVHVFIGYLNARTPHLRKLELVIPKRSSVLDSLRIVMVSDIHLGTIISKERANKMVDKINRLDPDIILLAGDIVDEDLAPVIKENIGESLRNLKAKLGVYGITGNHEYIGGAEPAVKYLTEHGIKMLRDTVVLIGHDFNLAGREDRDRPRFTGKPRKSLEEVLAGADPSYPIILMDHQPFNLPKVAEMGVDLQVSGHTHHGQIWPLNYITRAIYELSWGYKMIGRTHFYVSCGYGTWGPPVRLGNRPEIVEIKIDFKEKILEH